MNKIYSKIQPEKLLHIILRKDEEGKVYDLVDWVKRNEYMLFPTIHPDFLDALSRIYDMDPTPPISRSYRVLEPEAEAAY